MGEGPNRYEILRRQALEPELGDTSTTGRLEQAIIERQGLVAWLERGPNGLPASLGSADRPTLEQRETEAPHRDLVLALAGLVVGNRQEEDQGGES